MSGELAWYETRKKWRKDPAMRARAKRIDRALTKWAKAHGHYHAEPPRYVQFPPVDLGRVTWSRFEPVHQPAGDDDDDVLYLPATTRPLPSFPDDIIPRHLLFIELSGLLDEDPGFEDFGGGQTTTQVYFAQAAFSGLIKIGIATDLTSRLASLRTGASEPLILLQAVPANQTFECYLHGLFEPIRSHGEWFYPHWSLFEVIGGLDC